MSDDSSIVQLTQAVACSFCTGHYYGALCNDGGSAIHSTPTCVTFDELDHKHYERQGSKVSPGEAVAKLRELVAEALARQYLKDIIR